MRKAATIDEKDYADGVPMVCPECGKGHLSPRHLFLRLQFGHHLIEADGQGYACEGGCERRMLSASLREEVANKAKAIESGGSDRRYVELNRQTGEMKNHSIH